MSEYKLVPVEPTAEMMATGGIEMGARDEDARTVWTAMLAAAPAVQGEPVALPTDAQLVEIARNLGALPELCGTADHPDLSWHIRTDVRNMVREVLKLYASPQPADQQPACASQSVKSDTQATLSTESERQAPDVPGLTEALRQYQHNDGSGLVFGYDKLLVDQYVAGLVEALRMLAAAGSRLNDEAEECMSEDGMAEVASSDYWGDFREALEAADAALAAYRKGGE